MATNETNTTTTTMLTGAVFNDHDYVASTIFNSEENIELLLDILEEEKEFDEVVLNILDEVCCLVLTCFFRLSSFHNIYPSKLCFYNLNNNLIILNSQ